MTSKSPKKTSRKRAKPKKEVEIPVYFTSKKAGKEPEDNPISENYFLAEKPAEEKYQLLENEDDLPVLGNVNDDAGGKHDFREETPGSEEEIAREMKKLKEKNRENAVVAEEAVGNIRPGGVSSWSMAKKKTVMWASVVSVAFVVFVAWLFVVQKSFSFDLGAQSYTVWREAAGEWQEAKAPLSELGEELSSFEESFEQEEIRETGGDEAVNKLKEKILVDELKNKLTE